MIGLASGTLCWLLLSHFQLGDYDLTWSLQPAKNLLAGQNPYENLPAGAVGYPMTAVLLVIPLVWLPKSLAAGVFFGCSSALLALGLSRQGHGRLLVFLAYPYWAALLTAQWTPLIMASAFFSLLLPLSLVKPQVGLPVLMTNFSRRGAVACIVLLSMTFLALPRWFGSWTQQLNRYQYFVPLLVLPGPLLLMALWKYKERDTWFLLAASAMPQRWFYDAFTLWLIPKTRREIVWTVFFSWGAGILRWYDVPHHPLHLSQVGRWTVLFHYLPMLAVLLVRSWKGPGQLYNWLASRRERLSGHG